MYLLGGREAEEKYGPDNKKPLLIVVREMAEKAKSQHIRLITSKSEHAADSKAAQAWDLIVDAYFKAGAKFQSVEAKQLRQRALHMVSFYLDELPNPWPKDPEVMRKLFKR